MIELIRSILFALRFYIRICIAIQRDYNRRTRNAY